MNFHRVRTAGLFVLALTGFALAQPPGGPGGPGQPPGGGRGGDFFGGPPGGATRKILEKFDKDKNGWLNKEERVDARAEAKKGGGRGGRGFGGMGGGGNNFKPGPHLEPGEVESFPNKKLYDTDVLRTLFLEFENKDWEAELQDFHGTDVDVPCSLTVDGKTYKNVGVHFRGMSSYMGVPAGGKRSLNLKMHLADKKQNLLGYHTLNLLNCHEDDSCLSSALASHIARQYMPAPKVNMVRVVINGECWGLYSNQQQFDGKFLEENYKTKKGTRWKIRGNPGGRGGLEYFGDDLAQYKRIFDMKTDDNEDAWKALVKLCKTLKETPADQLADVLPQMVDVDNLLWFLAIDCSIVNDDGYWTRASDYSIYLDPKGKFHFIPSDMNECFLLSQAGRGGRGPMAIAFSTPGEILASIFRDQLKLTDDQKKQIDTLQKDTDERLAAILTDEQKKQMKDMKDRPPGMIRGPGGPGGFGPPGGGASVKLDPMVGMNSDRFPLRSKVLAVPAFKEKYLANVRTIAEKSLDWKTLGPVVARYRAMLEKDVEKDTRKLGSLEGFRKLTADAAPANSRELNLRSFADQRRVYLLEATAKKEPSR